MAQMNTYIAGVSHRPGARERLGQLLQGEGLTLAREPDNPHDRNAVAVYDGELQLGYVPAADAPTVAKAMAQLPVRAKYLGVPASTSIMITWGED